MWPNTHCTAYPPHARTHTRPTRRFVYISPFYWTETSIINNEFADDTYLAPYPGGGTYGSVYMASYDFPFSDTAKWGGIGVLLGWIVAGIALQIIALRYLRFNQDIGTKRRAAGVTTDFASDAEKSLMTVSSASHRGVEQADADAETAARSAAAAIAHQLHASAASLRVVQFGSNILAPHVVTLSWSGVGYSVPVKAGDKVLLRDVSGYAAPGTLTALM